MSSIREKAMPKKGVDTRVRRVASRIVADVDSEGALHDAPPDLEEMLRKVQSDAILLSVSTSELIGLMDAMENPQEEEPDEPTEPGDTADPPEAPDEADPGESDEPEGEDEKD